MLLCIVCTHSIFYSVSLIIQSILLNVILCSLWQYGCSVSQDCWISYQYRHANLWLTHTRRMHLHIHRLIQRTYYTSTLTNYNWHQDYILWGDLTHSIACLTFNIWNLKSENWKWGFFSLHNMDCRSCLFKFVQIFQTQHLQIDAEVSAAQLTVNMNLYFF